MLMKATEYTLVIAWPALLFMAIESHAIIGLLFGTSWLGAAPVLQALCIAQLLQVVAGQANAVYLATGDIKLKLRNEVILQSIALSLLLLGMSHSVLLVAWLRVGFGLSHLLVHMSALRRYGDIGFPDLGKALVRPLALAALFAIVLVGLRLTMPEPWRNHPMSVFPLAAVMFLVYAFFLMASRHPIVREMSRSAPRKRA